MFGNVVTTASAVSSAVSFEVSGLQELMESVEAIALKQLPESPAILDLGRRAMERLAADTKGSIALLPFRQVKKAIFEKLRECDIAWDITDEDILNTLRGLEQVGVVILLSTSRKQGTKAALLLDVPSSSSSVPLDSDDDDDNDDGSANCEDLRRKRKKEEVDGKPMVVVRPSWLTQLLATIVTTRRSFRNGILPVSNLPTVWSDRKLFPPNKYSQMLALLEDLMIVHPLNSSEILVPCLLSDNKPNLLEVWPEIAPEIRTDGAPGEIAREYALMPSRKVKKLPVDLMSRLLVDFLRHGWKPIITWQSGFVLGMAMEEEEGKRKDAEQKRVGDVEEENREESVSEKIDGDAAGRGMEQSSSTVKVIMRVMQLTPRTVLVQLRWRRRNMSIAMAARAMRLIAEMMRIHFGDLSCQSCQVSVPHRLHPQSNLTLCYYHMHAIRTAFLSGRTLMCSKGHREEMPFSVAPDVLLGGLQARILQPTDWTVVRELGQGGFGTVDLAVLKQRVVTEEDDKRVLDGENSDLSDIFDGEGMGLPEDPPAYVAVKSISAGVTAAAEAAETFKENPRTAERRESGGSSDERRSSGESAQFDLISVSSDKANLQLDSGTETALSRFAVDTGADVLSSTQAIRKIVLKEGKGAGRGVGGTRAGLIEHLETTWREMCDEAWAMDGMAHPNVVKMIGVCLRPPCIIMEAVLGGNLYDELHSPLKYADECTVAIGNVLAEIGKHNLYVNIRQTETSELPPLQEMPAYATLLENLQKWEDVLPDDRKKDMKRIRRLVEAVPSSALYEHHKDPSDKLKFAQANDITGAISELVVKHKRDVNCADWTLNYKLVLDIALGLAHLHSHKIIHRDIKSPNIFVTKPLSHFREIVITQNWDANLSDLSDPLAKVRQHVIPSSFSVFRSQ